MINPDLILDQKTINEMFEDSSKTLKCAEDFFKQEFGDVDGYDYFYGIDRSLVNRINKKRNLFINKDILGKRLKNHLKKEMNNENS